MRTRGDIDQKYLSELYYQYMNVEEDFGKGAFLGHGDEAGPRLCAGACADHENTLHILDYERATHIIEEAEYIGLGLCYCRHKMLHAGHPCEIGAPLDVCADLWKRGPLPGGARRLRPPHRQGGGMDALQRSYDHNLGTEVGENVRGKSGLYLQLLRLLLRGPAGGPKFSPMQPVATTNYIPEVKEDTCVGCGRCEKGPVRSLRFP